MTKAEIRDEALAQLSAQERADLAVELWESLGPEDLEVPDWHREIVRERLEEHRRDPGGALPGEDLLAWLSKPRA